MKDVRLLQFSQNGDARGHMVVVEGLQHVPFEIKRIFYSYGAERNAVRGKHSNRKSEFVMVCVAGSCKILVKDGKGNEEEYCLDKPNVGLYLPKLVWKEMYDFSEDCVLLVLSSEHYDSEEYIRDYEQLVQIMRD